MNKLDSELIANELARHGFELTQLDQEADIVIFNTCSVRQHAENRVLTCLARLAEKKLQKPSLVAALIGCMAQRQGAQLLEQFGALDIVCAPGELHQLRDLIKNAQAGAPQQLALTERLRARRAVPRALEELDISRRPEKGSSKAQAYVRVTRGCDKYCTYCIVPSVRGREISRSPEHILNEVQKLIDAGYIEITLLGQTVNSYCYRSDSREVRFGELLRKVGAISGLKRLRFVTSHPLDFTEDIFQAMAEIPAMCNYLHLPAQSGSDHILSAMHRPYTAGQYLKLIELGRTIVPDLSLAGDFIVGFPGETEQDFQDTVQLVREARYKNCFIFKYSPRPGTVAAKRLKDDVPTQIKRRRNNALLDVQEEISMELHQAFIGQTLEVLVEGPSKSARKGRPEHQQQLTSRTRGDHIVVFDAPVQAAKLTGKLVNVKIRDASALTLFGELTKPV